MQWIQIVNPFNNIALSALVAAIPIFFLFITLAVFRMKGHIVGILTLVITILISILVFNMPVQYSLLSTLYGALYGFIPIGWIVLTAVLLYNLTVKSGYFEIIKDSICSITCDKRLQLILIAFSFGAFLEGCAGFGTPVAITAAMLTGLGFRPLHAAGLCLIANTAPVAFGAVGIPIMTAGAVSNIDYMVISKMVGRQLPILSLFLPFWLVFTYSGWKGAKGILPALILTGFSFALTEFLTANFLTPLLADILASIVSITCLIIFLRFWKPSDNYDADNETVQNNEIKKHPAGTLLKAWSPFITLTILIFCWGLLPVKTLLDKLTTKIVFSGLDKMIIVDNKPLDVVFNFNWLSTAGTSILIATFVSAIMLDMNFKDYIKVFIDTVKNLKYALLTICCVLGFAYIANWSGMTHALGQALTITGVMFPFVSAFIGWLGVFITGSDTSSNALFCNLQRITAESMNLNPVLTVAANSSGGVAAKMISPQSIVVGTSSTGLTGKEGDLLRFTLPHSIFFATIIGLITLIQAYIFPGIIPKVVTGSFKQMASVDHGLYILIGMIIVLAMIKILIIKLDAKDSSAYGD